MYRRCVSPQYWSSGIPYSSLQPCGAPSLGTHHIHSSMHSSPPLQLWTIHRAGRTLLSHMADAVLTLPGQALRSHASHNVRGCGSSPPRCAVAWRLLPPAREGSHPAGAALLQSVAWPASSAGRSGCAPCAEANQTSGAHSLDRKCCSRDLLALRSGESAVVDTGTGSVLSTVLHRGSSAWHGMTCVHLQPGGCCCTCFASSCAASLRGRGCPGTPPDPAPG